MVVKINLKDCYSGVQDQNKIFTGKKVDSWYRDTWSEIRALVPKRSQNKTYFASILLNIYSIEQYAALSLIHSFELCLPCNVTVPPLGGLPPTLGTSGLEDVRSKELINHSQKTHGRSPKKTNLTGVIIYRSILQCHKSWRPNKCHSPALNLAKWKSVPSHVKSFALFPLQLSHVWPICIGITCCLQHDILITRL